MPHISLPSSASPGLSGWGYVLFTGVRGIGILRSSPCLPGYAEALWQEYHGLGPKVWPTGLARCAEAGERSMHRVRCARNEPREPRLLWAWLRLSRGGDEGRAREGTLHCSALRWDGS